MSSNPERFNQESLDEFQQVPIHRDGRSSLDGFGQPGYPELRRKPRRRWWKFWLLVVVLLAFYFFFPIRTNILILGTDYMPHRGTIGRTDTMILTTITPTRPYVGMLSIPRDLWVSIPGFAENRINTAYYYAEADQRGSGPQVAMNTVKANFGVRVDYYVVLYMSGVVDMIDALGGIDITLEEPMGGLETGSHHLHGEQALAFARERYSADDISRMAQGQLLIKAMMQKFLDPLTWFRLPGFLVASGKAIQTNIPGWLWPRLGLALLRSGPQGIDARLVGRDMVVPFQTADGAQVLAPDWQLINPLLLEMFGK